MSSVNVTLEPFENATAVIDPVGFAIGITSAIFSAIFNGSFAAIIKMPSVAKHELDPVVFMCYFTIGTCFNRSFNFNSATA